MLSPSKPQANPHSHKFPPSIPAIFILHLASQNLHILSSRHLHDKKGIEHKHNKYHHIPFIQHLSPSSLTLAFLNFLQNKNREPTFPPRTFITPRTFILLIPTKTPQHYPLIHATDSLPPQSLHHPLFHFGLQIILLCAPHCFNLCTSFFCVGFVCIYFFCLFIFNCSPHFTAHTSH